MPRKSRFAVATVLLMVGAAASLWGDDSPKAKPPETPRLDAFGDPLPLGALARFGTVRLRHDAKAAAFVDDKTVVSVGSSIRFWDVATGKLIREHRHEKMTDVADAIISADGKRAFTFGSKYRIWDIATGQLVQELTKNSNQEFDMIIEPGKRIFATADGSKFMALEITLDRNFGISLQAVIHSMNGKSTPIKLQPGWNPQGAACAILPDGSRVVTGTDPAARGGNGKPELVYWNATDGKRLRSEDPNVGVISQIEPMPDGKALVAVGATGFALRTVEGKELWRQKSETEAMSVACATRDRLILVEHKNESSSAEVAVLDAANGKRLAHWPAPSGASGTAAVSPDGKKLVMVGEGRLYVVNLADGKEVVAASGHSGKLWTSGVTADGRYLAASDNVEHDAFLWDIATGQLARRFHGHSESGLVLGLSPDCKLLAAYANDATILGWDLATGQQVFKIQEIDQPVWALRFSPDNKRLAVVRAQGGVAVYDCSTGKVVHELAVSEASTPSGVARLADGRLLAAYTTYEFNRMGETKSTGVDVLDVDAQRVVRHFKGVSGSGVRANWSRDLRTLATRGDGMIKLWEMATGQLRITIKESATEPNRQSELPFNFQQEWAPRFAFSPDGLTMAVIGVGKSGIELWDLPSGQQFGTLRNGDRVFTTVDFTPDGRRLLTGGEDTTILYWDMTRPEWQSRLLAGNLTDAELATHWERLRGANAEEAYRSKWALVRDPKRTVDYLRAHIRQETPIPVERINSWIADLDARQYAVRERAHRELLDHVDLCADLLRQTLAKPISPEVRNRVTRIIDANFAAIPQADQLRDLRSIEVLEQIATPEARALLRLLAASEPRTRISRDAAESLHRLEASAR